MEILSLKKKIHEDRTKRVLILLKESYGSFPEQYNATKIIADDIINKIENNEYVDKGEFYLIKTKGLIPFIGEVNFSVKWFERKYGDTIVRGVQRNEGNEIFIDMVVYTPYIVNYNLSSTIAHEIMHCFQKKLNKVKGINEKSELLYYNLLSFYNNAPGRLSALFFYGLYICYNIEANANISSVSNYISDYFKDIDKNKITTKDIQIALNRFEKYSGYREIFDSLKGKSFLSFTEDDIRYITKCLTNPMKDISSGQYKYYFLPEDFNVETFVNENIKIIVNISEKVLKKMNKNIMNFLEEKNNDNFTKQNKDNT